MSRRDRDHARHLSDDQLLEIYVLAAESSHLHACASCADRFDRVVDALDSARDAATDEADAVFTAARLHDQHDRIMRRLEHNRHPADVLLFPSRSGDEHAVHRLLAPARRWVAGAAAAGLVAGLFLGFAAERRVGTMTAANRAKAVSVGIAQAAVSDDSPLGPVVKDEQMLTEIEDALAGPRRAPELRALDAMTTPAELQEASFDPR